VTYNFEKRGGSIDHSKMFKTSWSDGRKILAEKHLGERKTFLGGAKEFWDIVFESYNESMYTILQKLDNIERALHRFETRQKSIDTVPYRSADVTDIFKQTIQAFLLSFFRIIWYAPENSSRKSLSLSIQSINISLVTQDSKTEYHVNVTRKKDDGNICTAILERKIPDVPGDAQLNCHADYLVIEAEHILEKNNSLT
jgi:hypothetical protein